MIVANSCHFCNLSSIYFHSPGTSVGVSSILLGLVLIGRAAFVFPLSFISNLTKKSQNDKIAFKQQVDIFYIVVLSFSSPWILSCSLKLFKQVTIWWAGLMRGAVSVALAYNQVKVGQVYFATQYECYGSSHNIWVGTLIHVGHGWDLCWATWVTPICVLVVNKDICFGGEDGIFLISWCIFHAIIFLQS